MEWIVGFLAVLESLGPWLINAGVVSWVFLNRPGTRKVLKILVRGGVNTLDEDTQKKTRRVAGVALEMLKEAQVTLPMLFDNPAFVWDDIGEVLLEAVICQGKLQDPAGIDRQLLRDEVLEQLLQEDLSAIQQQRSSSPADLPRSLPR